MVAVLLRKDLFNIPFDVSCICQPFSGFTSFACSAGNCCSTQHQLRK